MSTILGTQYNQPFSHSQYDQQLGTKPCTLCTDVTLTCTVTNTKGYILVCPVQTIINNLVQCLSASSNFGKLSGSNVTNVHDCCWTMPIYLRPCCHNLTMTRCTHSNLQILCMPSSIYTGCTTVLDAPFHIPCDTSLFHLAVSQLDYRAICWVLTLTVADCCCTGDVSEFLFVG